MDTVTHTLFGLVLYGSVDKTNMDRRTKTVFLTTAVVGSQIPDIDVVSSFFDDEGQYQWWHRGITHSLFMVPVFAFILSWLAQKIGKIRDKRLFWLALLAVLIHNVSDAFNTWGTGLFEPFSSQRIAFGTIPIVDLTIWSIMLIGFLYRMFKKGSTHRLYHVVWLVIAAHFLIQTVQGYVIYQQYEDDYEQHVVSARFAPWHFSIIGNEGAHVEIIHDTVWGEPEVAYEFESAEEADLSQLFADRPEAEVVMEWSPFVVIVDDDETLGVFDPRFYRNGQSTVFEYIEKNVEDMFDVEEE
ncbi:metal-dependent hydrolase [Salsuginibacillus kocurii]|uniref:metal-dependent hydrolase n=1 Tax=Salsuginibacillus kocurii TaxID=427078 RepID=UPI0003785804|nr:metal-dependent hydrolase [Salsuginibacillus kocurii]